MVRLHRVAACTAVLAALTCPALPAGQAYPLELQLDPARSQIGFGFGATLHRVEGSLRVLSGLLHFDLNSGKGSGEVVLDLTSATTDNPRRDSKMHEKILETQRFPKAFFHLERIDGSLNRQGTSEIQLHGTLDFHGTSHHIALPAVVKVQGDQVTADGVFTIPYVEWGLDDPSFLVLRVEKTVEVKVHAVGRLAE